MNTLDVSKEKLVQSIEPVNNRSSGSLLWIAIVVGFFCGLLAMWHLLDRTLPAPDDSSFILGSFRYSELLHHLKFWRFDWWHEMLTVNKAYPPTVMFANGILRSLLGSGHWVNVLSVILFNGLLTYTIYGITRITTGDMRAALIAAVVVNLFPQTCLMSHGFALDAPLMSMISAGLFLLLWWRVAPSWKKTVLCGLGLGFACLTKQIAAAYLLLPGVLCLVQSVRNDMKNGRWYQTSQIFVMAGIAALLCLPWWLTNLSFIRHWANDNQVNMGHLTLWQVFPQNMAWYANSLASIASPVLFAGFLLSMAVVGKGVHRRLLPLTLSALGGVSSVSTLTWAFPSLRYVAPVMVAMAVYTGCGLSQLFNKKALKPFVFMYLLMGVLQFIAFNFAPYPISRPAFVAQISERLGVNLIEIFGLTARDRRESQIKHSIPIRNADWGQEWVLRTIDRFEGRKAVFLNILPEAGTLNGNTFELVGRMIESPVRATTSRKWTVMGDCIEFSPEIAMYYQWYLLKSGHQGNLLRDDASEANYKKLIAYIQNSGRFSLIGTRPAPDGSTLFLYRQN